MDDPGNKKYAKDALGRTVLVEAYGEKIENLDAQGYRVLSDEELAAQREAYNAGRVPEGSSVLSSSTAKPKPEANANPDEDGDAAVTWDNVTKDNIDAYAADKGIEDYPKSGTKDEKIAALGDGVTAADVKAFVGGSS
jgi:hypothetical protein